MAIAIVGTPFSQAMGAADGGDTGTFDSTGADLIVVGVSWYGLGSAPNVTDSKGNSWTALTSQLGAASTAASRLWYTKPTTVGGGHYITVAGTGIYPAVGVICASGTHATVVLDDEITAQDGASATANGGPMTPANNGSLFISLLSLYFYGSDATVDSGLTTTGLTVPYVNGVNLGLGMGYIIQGTAASLDPQWTWDANPQDATVSNAIFIPAAGGGGGGPTIKSLATLGVG
jgi:hypothetical protein